MPYAPGVVDRSGELLAAGRMDMAKGLAQGIGAVGDAMQEYRQNKMRNAVLEGENEQLIKVLSQDPELKKYVPEADTLDKLIEKKTTGGGLTLKDNMKLNAMLNTGLKVSKHVSDLQQQDMQRQMAAAQIGEVARKAAQVKADQSAFGAALGKYMPGGEMEGKPLDAALLVSDAIKAGAAPDAAREWLGTLTQREGVQARNAATQLTAQERQRKQFIEQLATSVAQGGAIPAYVNASDVPEIQQLAAEKRKKATQVVREDVDGVPTQVTTLPGGQVLRSRIQSNKPTAEEAMLEAQGKKTGETLAVRAQSAIDAIPQHQSTLDNIQRVRVAYAKGAKSGIGQQFIDEAKGFINTINGEPMFDLRNQEVAKQGLADFSLGAAARMKGQGSITENERKLLAETVAKFGNTEAGNLAIMEFMQAVAEREIRKGEYFAELADTGKFNSRSQAEFYRKNPLKLPSFEAPVKPDLSGVGSIIGR